MRKRWFNLFDTADAYANGQSEVMLGQALGPRRKDVVISTTAEEVTELDQATAPTPLYPNWFHERTVDARVRDALRQGLPAGQVK